MLEFQDEQALPWESEFDVASDVDDGESYDDYMSSIHSDGLSIGDDLSEEMGAIKKLNPPVINSDFYHSPQDVQLAIYASDLVQLQDQNHRLSKQVARLSDSYKTYRKECDLKTYEIDRITKERDKALGDTFTLKRKIEDILSETSRIREELEVEKRRRGKELEAEKIAVEESLMAAKYELAKCSEKYDNLEFSVAQVRMENTKLRETSRTQTEQLHHLGKLLYRSGVKMSSIGSATADLKFGKYRKIPLESAI